MAQEISPGIYPMLYSFFDEQGVLQPDPFRIQVDAAVSNDAAGVAILGLGTEVSKLSTDERLKVLDVVSRQLDGRKPLLVTVYGNSPEEQTEFCATAIDYGATALILQPPKDKLEDGDLSHFFSEVISSVDCPTGIQNAPEFIGFGLSNASLIKLANSHSNFTIAKLECSAVALEPVATELKDKVMVFNGRCGLELTDNLRAGATGLIPALETVDKTTDIFSAFLSGDEEHADKLYKELLPVISFIMQGLPHFLTYGKLLAAIRLGIEYRGCRNPSLEPTRFGIACTQRFADRLGELKR